MARTVMGLFKDSRSTNNALEELDNLGYTESDVSVVTKEENVKVDHETAGGVGDAIKKGGLVGGLVGLLAGIAALVVPGIGALFLAGPAAAALGLTGAAATTASGALTGALAGGLIGALKEIGVDDVRAKNIEERVKDGDTLLMVNASGDEEKEVEDVMRKHHGDDVTTLDLKI
jgi:uncharacterized membrane protein